LEEKVERKGGEEEAKEGRWWSSKLEMADERTIPPEVFSGDTRRRERETKIIQDLIW